jgi:chloride channel protein, CIC family
MNREVHEQTQTLPKTPVQRAFARVRDSDTLVMLTFAMLVGVGAGLGAVAFIKAISVVQVLLFGQGREALGFMGRWYVVVIPAVGGLIVGPLIHFLAPEAKGHGVPEVMTAMETRGGRIRPIVIVVKAVGSAITIGSGGSVGREGPIVQIGAAIGSALGQRFGLSRKRILGLVGAGAAAGVAATFNAPIAGVMFALEVLLGDYSVSSISTMVFAAVSASVVSRFFLGVHPAFTVPSYTLVSAWELPFYLGLGVVGALAASAFVRFLYFAEDVFGRWHFPEYLKPAVGGLAIGLLGYFLPQIFGTGFATIEHAANGQLALSLLLILVFAKILATSITLGSGSSGGVFAPALFVGAMVGGAYGQVVHRMLPTLTAGNGAYATVGMAVVFAAAARAPITAIVILFELTLDYRIMLPLMLATVVATVIAEKLEPESIYTLKLVRRGIDFRGRIRANARQQLTVGEVMTPAADIPTVTSTMTLAELADFFRSTGVPGTPVLDDQGRLSGIVTIGDLEHSLPDFDLAATVAEICKCDVLTASPEDRLDQLLARPGYLDVGRIPVIDPADPGRLVGMLRRIDIVRAFTTAGVSVESSPTKTLPTSTP